MVTHTCSGRKLLESELHCSSADSVGSRARGGERARCREPDARDVRLSSRPPRAPAAAAPRVRRRRRGALRHGSPRPLRAPLRDPTRGDAALSNGAFPFTSNSAPLSSLSASALCALRSSGASSVLCLLGATRCASDPLRRPLLKAMLDELKETCAERVRQLRDNSSKTLFLCAAERGTHCAPEWHELHTLILQWAPPQVPCALKIAMYRRCLQSCYRTHFYHYN